MFPPNRSVCCLLLSLWMIILSDLAEAFGNRIVGNKRHQLINREMSHHDDGMEKGNNDFETDGVGDDVERKMMMTWPNRRDAMKQFGISSGTMLSILFGVKEEDNNGSNVALAASSERMVSGEEVARRLRKVPTFAIVDGNGTPFATYSKTEGTATGYFFTTYEGATYVLEDARKAFAEAKEAGKPTEDSWGDSQIVSVSLAQALQLSVKKQSNIIRNNINNQTVTTYYQILPGAEELSFAMKLEKIKSSTKSVRYSERGRVPLFYSPLLTLPSPSNENEVVQPMYFSAKDLIVEWDKQQQSSANPQKIPSVEVRELTEIFYAMLKPGGEDQSVKNMVFMATSTSLEKVKELSSANNNLRYNMGQVVLTT